MLVPLLRCLAVWAPFMLATGAVAQKIEAELGEELAAAHWPAIVALARAWFAADEEGHRALAFPAYSYSSRDAWEPVAWLQRVWI